MISTDHNSEVINKMSNNHIRSDYAKQQKVLRHLFRQLPLHKAGHDNNRSAGIKRHSSTDEYNYFRGVATTVALTKRLSVSAFLPYLPASFNIVFHRKAGSLLIAFIQTKGNKY